MKVSNLFREFTMKNIKGYNQLTKKEQDIFDATYLKHLSSMSEEKKKLYSENHLEEIKRNEDGFTVKFRGNRLYIYFLNKKWLKIF